jgi:dTMP kinase
MAVEQIRFPERSSSVGQLIDSYLKSTNNLNDQTIHLLFSSNRWEQSNSIEEKLKNGCTLVRKTVNITL